MTLSCFHKINWLYNIRRYIERILWAASGQEIEARGNRTLHNIKAACSFLDRLTAKIFSFVEIENKNLFDFNIIRLLIVFLLIARFGLKAEPMDECFMLKKSIFQGAFELLTDIFQCYKSNDEAHMRLL